MLARRLATAAGGRGASGAGLLAAFAVAVYPPFIHSTGELMREPPAILTLPAAVLAFSGRANGSICAPGSCPVCCSA